LFEGEGIYKYEANGAGEIEPGTEPSKFSPAGEPIAVDSGTGDLYVGHSAGHSGYVAQYGPSGALKGELGKEVLGTNIRGIAVSSETGYVYVSNTSENNVAVFGPPVVVPDATTAPASEVARTSATLHGSIAAAAGPPATCVFQYADAASFEAERFKSAATAPCTPAGPFTGTSMQEVEAEISGLQAGTAFHYRLLASNENGANDNVNEQDFQTQPAVTLQTGKASNLSPGTATLNGTITPEAIALDECLFEYGETATYGQSVPCAESPAEIGTGNDPVPVHADLSALDPLAVYHFRLVAKNSFGTTKGADFIFGPPRVDASSFSQVTATSAAIQGLVNPDGVATTYRVEYVSEAGFEEDEWAHATSVPLAGEAIGSGGGDIEVGQQLSGLAARTTYHFRITAESAAGETNGLEKVFTTYGEEGAGLPDGRAYEQVTPVDKGGTAPRGETGRVQAASDGNGIAFFSHGGIPGSEGGQRDPLYLSTRDLDWSTQGLLPPGSAGGSASVAGWGEDLSQVYVSQGVLPGGKSPVSFMERDSATRSLRAIVSEADAGLPSFRYVGAADNGSVVAFESDAALSLGGAENASNVYVWDKASGELSLAGAFNTGEAPTEGSLAGSNEDLVRGHLTQAQHTVANDGSGVVFSDAGTGQLYLRQNPTQPQSPLEGEKCAVAALACTVEISASQRSTPDPDGPKPATFMAATKDGSKAFFTSSAKLTNNAKTGPDDEGADLYRYDAESGKLIDLSPDAADPNGAEVRGVLGASDDGSYVYFAANGKLTSTPNAQGQSAAPGDCSLNGLTKPGEGSCNLYLWHEGAIEFIAPLQLKSDYSRSDGANWISALQGQAPEVENTARVSADGHTLLFRSQQQLTAYDNEGKPELYTYRTSDADLRCVSCNPTGTAPAGPATLRSITTFLEAQPSPASVLTRNLSADGTRVFFETADKLVIGDTNGVKDVYEWEGAGAGSCPSDAKNGGCLYLISTGTSPEPSYLADTSADGDNAFFFTVQPLVGQDQDQIVDIYDARVGGGIASQNAPPPPPICEGEACKGPATTPPAGESSGSAGFSGPGNQKTSHHKRKKKRHHGRRKNHVKRHHVKRHATRKRG
jgi:hypothetical protein